MPYWLQQKAEEEGLQPTDIQKRLNISPSTWHLWVRGKRFCNSRSCKRLQRLLKISESEIYKNWGKFIEVRQSIPEVEISIKKTLTKRNSINGDTSYPDAVKEFLNGGGQVTMIRVGDGV